MESRSNSQLTNPELGSPGKFQEILKSRWRPNVDELITTFPQERYDISAFGRRMPPGHPGFAKATATDCR
jgi:hypothetical protein